MTALRGIAVSRWQGAIAWLTVKPQIEFAYIKAGGGDDISPYFDYRGSENAKGARNAGIPFGFYCFYSVRNTGAGHYLPTYVTPRLIAEIEQLDSDGRSLPGTRIEKQIQRQVPLDLGSETADTRLPPDGELRLVYERPAHRAAVALAYRLRVEPDEFYARFYRALLADSAAGKGRELIALALKQAESSAFLAFDERRELPQR